MNAHVPIGQVEHFTKAERAGARRLIDCGSFTHAEGTVPLDMYVKFISRGWATATKLKTGKWLVQITPQGRDRRHILERIAA